MFAHRSRLQRLGGRRRRIQLMYSGQQGHCVLCQSRLLLVCFRRHSRSTFPVPPRVRICVFAICSARPGVRRRLLEALCGATGSRALGGVKQLLHPIEQTPHICLLRATTRQQREVSLFWREGGASADGAPPPQAPDDGGARRRRRSHTERSSEWAAQRLIRAGACAHSRENKCVP